MRLSSQKVRVATWQGPLHTYWLGVFARLFNYSRFEHGGWSSSGHWRTDAYTACVTPRRPRYPLRAGDPPPPLPKAAQEWGKRDCTRAPLGAPVHQGRDVADEFCR